MNKNTENQVAVAQSAVDAMAVVTLSPEKYAAEVYQPFKGQLAAAIDSVRAVDYDITTTAGMASAVKCRALFRDMRVAADKERKARKEPITKIGKLLESGFDQFEERITPLEEMFDADIKAEEGRKEAEKAAKIKAERERTEAIADAIAGLREDEADAIRICKTAESVRETLAYCIARPVTVEIFQERHAEAMKIHAEVVRAICVVLAEREESEAAAADAEQARLAEIARIAAARVEHERLAAIERAALAEQRAENERIASEHAAERKRIEAEHAEERRRLVALHAEQEAAAAALAEKAAASLRADREAQEKAAADAQAVLAAEAQRLADERQAFEDEKSAVAAAAQKEADHAEALAMNSAHDEAYIKWLANQPLRDTASSTTLPELATAAGEADELFPTDAELVEQIREMFDFHFGQSADDADTRMATFDYARAVAAMGAA